MSDNVTVAGIITDAPIPEDWTPYEAIVIIKALDSGGKARLCLRISGGWTMWEAIGALEGFATSINQDFQNSLGDDESDAEEPE